jgi:hypothetical protein
MDSSPQSLNVSGGHDGGQPFQGQSGSPGEGVHGKAEPLVDAGSGSRNDRDRRHCGGGWRRFEPEEEWDEGMWEDQEDEPYYDEE